MAILPVGSTPIINAPSSDEHARHQFDSTQTQPEQLSATELRNQRVRQHNLAILEANQKASLSVSGEPLSLLYQTAIDAINAELAPTLGDRAIERTQLEGIDTSPEATADRIVSMSLGTFGKYQELHADLPESEQVDGFLALVSSGIDQGFGAAKDILEGLSVLEGSIADDINKTYELVQLGLEQFREHFMADKKGDEQVSDT